LPFRCLLFLGKYLGRLGYYLPTRGKTTAKINIDACFPDWSQKRRDTLLRQYFESLGMSVFETAVAWWAPTEKIAKLANIRGLEQIPSQPSPDQAIMVLGGHFLPMELIGRLFSLHLNFSVIFREPKHPLLRFLLTGRQALYHQLHDRRNMISFVKELRQGMPLWYSPDIDPGKKEGVFAPFFNIPAYSLTATTRLAKIANARVFIASYFRRDDNTGYDMVIHPPLDQFPSGDETADAARVNQAIESMIRQKPEQYLWSYRRFRTRPPGEKKWY
jgi:KDO2-lipid IV(A) lauroyltransferase